MRKFEVTLGRGQVLLDGLLKNGIALAHECGGALACATCSVVVRDGSGTLSPIDENEQDMLDRAGMSGGDARLACQVISSGGQVVIEAPDAEMRNGKAPAGDTVMPMGLTERAAKHLAAQLSRRPETMAVRVAVERAGCSGLRYRFDHADDIAVDDLVFESHGIRIAVDTASVAYVQGATLDLVQEGLVRKLRLHNPNVRRTCGCGESFTL